MLLIVILDLLVSLALFAGVVGLMLFEVLFLSVRHGISPPKPKEASPPANAQQRVAA
jgi:hypothetical protein